MTAFASSFRKTKRKKSWSNCYFLTDLIFVRVRFKRARPRVQILSYFLPVPVLSNNDRFPAPFHRCAAVNAQNYLWSRESDHVSLPTVQSSKTIKSIEKINQVDKTILTNSNFASLILSFENQSIADNNMINFRSGSDDLWNPVSFCKVSISIWEHSGLFADFDQKQPKYVEMCYFFTKFQNIWLWTFKHSARVEIDTLALERIQRKQLKLYSPARTGGDPGRMFFSNEVQKLFV